MKQFRRIAVALSAGFSVLILMQPVLTASDRVIVATNVAWVFYGLIDAIQELGTANETTGSPKLPPDGQ